MLFDVAKPAKKRPGFGTPFDFIPITAVCAPLPESAVAYDPAAMQEVEVVDAAHRRLERRVGSRRMNSLGALSSGSSGATAAAMAGMSD